MLNGEQKQVEINTLRSGMGDLSLLQPGSKPSAKVGTRGFSRGNEPYLMQDIGSDRYATLTNRDTIPLNRALDDVSRLAQFYTSAAGLAYIAKENVTNTLIGTSTSNAVEFGGPKLNVGGRIILPPVPNPLQGNTGFLNFTNQFRDLGSQIASLRLPFRAEYSFRPTVGLPFGFLGDKPTESAGIKTQAITTGLEKTRYLGLGQGPNYKNSDLISNLKSQDALDTILDPDGSKPPVETLFPDIAIQPRDFYVRIRDLRDNQYIYFRGYVTGITENVNPSFSPVNYIGRSEPVYLYERGERDLSFNLRVYPANHEQLDAMYQKIDRLTSLAYPDYLEDEDDSSLTRMKAPFTELYMGHIGSKARGQFGFVKSISYTVNESGDWDANTRLPRLFDIAIGYQILNRKPPRLFGEPNYPARVDL